jgi:hypothetical protein
MFVRKLSSAHRSSYRDSSFHINICYLIPNTSIKSFPTIYGQWSETLAHNLPAQSPGNLASKIPRRVVRCERHEFEPCWIRVFIFARGWKSVMIAMGSKDVCMSVFIIFILLNPYVYNH